MFLIRERESREAEKAARTSRRATSGVENTRLSRRFHVPVSTSGFSRHAAIHFGAFTRDAPSCVSVLSGTIRFMWTATAEAFGVVRFQRPDSGTISVSGNNPGSSPVLRVSQNGPCCASQS
jgi:hypothetical protein